MNSIRFSSLKPRCTVNFKKVETNQCKHPLKKK